jgi:hypothetical protein
MQSTTVQNTERKITMSWQEMEAEEMSTPSEGYKGVSHNDSYAAPSFRQKLSTSSAASAPSSRQRLALALASLILWMIFFFVVAWIIRYTPAQIIVMNGQDATPITVDNSREFYTNIILLSCGLLAFSTIVLVINILFNRKH